MDTAHASLITAEPLADPQGSVWRGWLQSLMHRGVRRERLVDWHRARVAVLAMAMQLGAVTGLGAALWLGQRSAAEASARAAVAFVDGRLQELKATLRQVQVSLPENTAEAWVCSEDLTKVLLRASLDSMLVQRLWLVAADGEQACGPQGAGTLGELPPITELALVSLRSIATELVLAQRLPDGRLLAARLDPRALALPPGGPWDAAGDRGIRIALQSSDQRVLHIWNGGKSPGGSLASMQVHVRSEGHDHAVSAQWSHAAFWRQLAGHAPLASAVAALLTALICWRVWRHAMARSRLANRIERALRKRQFEPFVQPIVDIASGRCVGGEVLMRWAHPERGILAPGEFIDEAERTGLIVPMSALVMGRAAHRLAPLAQAHPQLCFSFNITALQLRRPGIARELADIFNADTLPRDQVLLELTEREALDPLTQRTVRALHAAGWRLAIDDFGTGQSSLAMLESMPIERLKIDRAFVSAVGEQTARRPVLDAIIGLARDLGVRLVAEGVETQVQWDYLAQRRVESAQGYLVARPMSLEDFGRWFEARLAPLESQAASPDNRRLGCVALGQTALQHDERLAGFWQAMLGAGGVDIRDRLFHLRLYRQCLVGREAVDWLARHAQVSRAEALRLGRRLVALGCLRHVVDEHDFEDGEYFYAVVADPASDTWQPPAADLREVLLGPQGPPLADHCRGLLRHRRCLRGLDLVDWLCAHYKVSRATALQWSAQCMKQGHLRHVFDDRPVSDSRALFRLA